MSTDRELGLGRDDDGATRLGRDVAQRMRRPGPPLGRLRPPAIGSLATAAVRFVAGTWRPASVRRALAGPEPAPVRRYRDARVAPPRWWAPQLHRGAVPGRPMAPDVASASTRVAPPASAEFAAAGHGANAPPPAATTAPPPTPETAPPPTPDTAPPRTPDPASRGATGAQVRRTRLEPAHLPARGLPTVVRRVPDEASWTPGGLLAGLVGTEARVRRLAEVTAIGAVPEATKLTAAAAMSRRAASRSAARPPEPTRTARQAMPARAPAPTATPSRVPPPAARPAASAPSAAATPAGVRSSALPTSAPPSAPVPAQSPPPPPPRPAPAPTPPVTAPPSAAQVMPTPPVTAPPSAAQVMPPPPVADRLPSATAPQAPPDVGSAPSAARAWRPVTLRSRFAASLHVPGNASLRRTPADVATSAALGPAPSALEPAPSPGGDSAAPLPRSVATALVTTLVTTQRDATASSPIVARRPGPLRRALAAPTPLRPSTRPGQALSRPPGVAVPGLGRHRWTDSRAARPGAAAPTDVAGPEGPAVWAEAVAAATPPRSPGQPTAGEAVPDRVATVRGSTPSRPAAARAEPPGSAEHAIALATARPLSGAYQRTADLRPTSAVLLAAAAPRPTSLPTLGPGALRRTVATVDVDGRAHRVAAEPAAGVVASAARAPAGPTAYPATRTFPLPAATASSATPSSTAAPSRPGAVATAEQRLAALAMPDLLAVRREATRGAAPRKALASGFGAPEAIRPATTARAGAQHAPQNATPQIARRLTQPTAAPGTGQLGGMPVRPAGSFTLAAGAPAHRAATTPATGHAPAAQPTATASRAATTPAATLPPAAAIAPALLHRLTVAPPPLSLRAAAAGPPVPAVAAPPPAQPSRGAPAAPPPAPARDRQSLVAATQDLFSSMMGGAALATRPGDTARYGGGHMPSEPAPFRGSSNPTIRRVESPDVVTASALQVDPNEVDPTAAAQRLDELVDRVVERIEQRVVDELERRGRRTNPGAF